MPTDVGASNYELEDYIFEMECHANRTSDGTPPTSGDVYACLAEKESNLVLAAELGKALLGRNEILVNENERMAEEYSRKLEELEQDKHLLRRKLITTEGEYEVKIHELSTDVIIAKSELREYQEGSKQTEKERGQIIEQLTEQNQRLTHELKESCREENEVTSQLKKLRDKMTLRQSNFTDHLSTLDSLRDEIMMLTDKRLELERRMNGLVEEREDLSQNLDESSDRIQVLEKQREEQNFEMRTKDRDLEDLRHNNLSLVDRLESISRASSAPSMGQTSLMNEMDLSENDGSRPASHQDLLEMDGDCVECDDPVLTPLSMADVLKMLQVEVVDSVGELRLMVDQMRNQRKVSANKASTTDKPMLDVVTNGDVLVNGFIANGDVCNGDFSNNSSDDFSASMLKAGMLTMALKEVKGLVRAQLRREAQGQCSSCGTKTTEDTRITLEQEMHKALEAVDRISQELIDAKDKLKAKTDEAALLSGQVTIQQARQNALQEERDNLKQDIDNTHLAKDEIVKKAWDTRDQAVARKNNCEIELAKTRIDLMQVNSQLLEAITQKVELSQQLDQWQQDMQQLLDDQMRRKLTKHELLYADNGPASDSDSSSTSRRSPRKSTKRLFNLLAMLRK